MYVYLVKKISVQHEQISETYNKCRVISAGYRYSVYFVFSDLFQHLSNKIVKRFVTVEMKFQYVSYNTRDIFVKGFYSKYSYFCRTLYLVFWECQPYPDFLKRRHETSRTTIKIYARA